VLPKTNQRLVVDVVCPAKNCAETLPAVLAALPSRRVRSAVVVDRGSTDQTAQIALDAGALVVREPRAGYGSSCRRAILHLESLPQPPDVVVFCAADGSDDPSELLRLLEPIETDNAELVIGVRGGRGRARPIRHRVALGLIGMIYRQRFEDLGPYRAIRFPALVAMGLTDPADGFHVEMQIKALNLGLRIVEVPVKNPPPAVKEPVIDRVKTAGRMLGHIIKHSTAR
jgi:glycosyltransferase involved in cell wall biosynthesis